MSTNELGDQDGPDGIATVEIRDGTVVIYDQENPRGWVQSAAAVPLAEMQ